MEPDYGLDVWHTKVRVEHLGTPVGQYDGLEVSLKKSVYFSNLF